MVDILLGILALIGIVVGLTVLIILTAFLAMLIKGVTQAFKK